MLVSSLQNSRWFVALIATIFYTGLGKIKLAKISVQLVNVSVQKPLVESNFCANTARVEAIVSNDMGPPHVLQCHG